MRNHFCAEGKLTNTESISAIITLTLVMVEQNGAVTSRMGTQTRAPSVDSKNSITQSYLERFLSAWQDSKGLSPRRLRIVFFAGLALICGVTAFIGAVPTRICGHDIFIPLENGWRVINGQRPHLDFTSPFGPVWFLVSALGLTISRHSADGIGYGNAIVALIVGIWSFFLGKNRLASAPRLILSFFLAALVGSSLPFG